MSPVTVAVRLPLDHVAVWPPGLAVTVYPVIAEPPVDAGAFQVTVACAFPAVAETLVGAVGGVGVAGSRGTADVMDAVKATPAEITDQSVSVPIWVGSLWQLHDAR